MTDSTASAKRGEPSSRVVGSDRVLVVLRELAEHPQGASLDDLSRAVASPKPTVHRALAALRRAGFATQNTQGHYLLGDEFLRLAFANHEARPDHVRVRPALHSLAERFGETAHYAVLEGNAVVYRDKVDPLSGAMRLTSTVGGRNPVHCTGVGKLLLAHAISGDDALRAWVAANGPLERRTGRTLLSVQGLAHELDLIRAQGYAVDNQENEEGVNCVAIPVWLASRGMPSGSVSVSALAHRTPLKSLIDAVPEIRTIVSSTSQGAS